MIYFQAYWHYVMKRVAYSKLKPPDILIISVVKCLGYFFPSRQQYHHLCENVLRRKKIRNHRKRCWKNIKIIIINRNSIWPRPVCQTKNWQTQLKGRFPPGSKAMWNYPCLLNLSLHFTLIIPSDPRDLLANCFSSFYFIMFDVRKKLLCHIKHVHTLIK